jgi:urate oxidase
MAHQLGHNQYGKAETRVVRIYRDGDPHEIVDYNVSAALSGDLADTHLTGDNAKVLTTDAVKNTVNAYAKEHGEAARQPESFALALARHFVEDVPQVSRARVRVEAYPWLRLSTDGTPHPHAFVREGQYTRTATVAHADGRAWVVSGLRDLVVLKSTDSEFSGFYQDRYTTLQPTNDRVMATSVTAQWWHTVEGRDAQDVDWGKAFSAAKDAMCEAFAASHSYALQQTLFEMGSAVLDAVPSVAEIRFSLPNKHHFVVDLSPFGLENRNEVFHADDRPYGLIEGTVRREDAPDPGLAFDPGQGW